MMSLNRPKFRRTDRCSFRSITRLVQIRPERVAVGLMSWPRSSLAVSAGAADEISKRISILSGS
jgi:hypothetical protein